MNALTYSTKDHARNLSVVVSRPMAAPVAFPAHLKPAKGLMFGLAIALVFWAAVAAVVSLVINLI